jgi:MOSC domain-containing protein YiiM
MAKIVAVCLSERKGTPKRNVGEGWLKENCGLIGDCHAGDPVRQVSLLPLESILKMRERGLEVGPGSFAENLTVEGLNFSELRIGTRLQVGEAVLEISQIGKNCPEPCEVSRRIGICIMPKQGVFARVIKGGKVRVGDEVRILEVPR